jgi:hypothetical protein
MKPLATIQKHSGSTAPPSVTETTSGSFLKSITKINFMKANSTLLKSLLAVLILTLATFYAGAQSIQVTNVTG